MILRVTLKQAIMAGSITGFGLAVVGGLALYATSGLGSDLPAGPFAGAMILMIIPLAIANASAWVVMRLAGRAMAPLQFHMALGVISAVILLIVCELVSQAFQGMGGGSLEPRTIAKIALLGAANAIVILLTWRFDIQPSRGLWR